MGLVRGFHPSKLQPGELWSCSNEKMLPTQLFHTPCNYLLEAVQSCGPPATQSADGRAAHRLGRQPARADGMRAFSCCLPNPSPKPGPSRTADPANDLVSPESYLKGHKLPELLKEAIATVVRERPEAAVSRMAELLGSEPTSCDRIDLLDAVRRAKESGRTPAVVVLRGAFNPVHAGHVFLLEHACNELERKTDWVAIAGLLLPADDDYVCSKVKKAGAKGESAMNLSQRVRCCELIIGSARRKVPLGVLSAMAVIAATARPSALSLLRATQMVQGQLRDESAPTLQPVTIEASDVIQKWIRVNSGGTWASVAAWERRKWPVGLLPLEHLVIEREGIPLPKEAPPEHFRVLDQDAKRPSDTNTSTEMRRLIGEGRWADLAAEHKITRRVSDFIRNEKERGTLFHCGPEDYS